MSTITPTNAVVVVRRSLKLLTEDFDLSLVLGQLIYWCTRTRDSQQYISEELKNIKSNGGSAGQAFGWIQKSARELDEELMTDRSDSTIRGYLKRLSRWVSERRIKGVHQNEYRVNLHLVIADLKAMGQASEEFEELLGLHSHAVKVTSTSKEASSEIENQSSEIENLYIKNTLKNNKELQERNDMSARAIQSLDINTFENKDNHTHSKLNTSSTYAMPETYAKQINDRLEPELWFLPNTEHWTSAAAFSAPIASMLWKTFKELVCDDTITLMFEAYNTMCAEYVKQGLKMEIHSPIGLFRDCFELGLSWYSVLKHINRSEWESRLIIIRKQMWNARRHTKKYRLVS